MPFCIHCGTQNPDVAKFCSNCGAAIITKPVPSPPPKEEPKPQPQVQIQTSTPIITQPESEQQVKQEPVVHTSVTAPVIETKQKETAAPATTGLNITNATRYVATWGALIVGIGFLLPWEPNYEYTGYFSGGNLNGLGVIKNLLVHAFRDSGGLATVVYLFLAMLTFLIFASAAIYFSNVMYGAKVSRLARIVRFIPLSIFVLIAIILIIGSLTMGDVPDIGGLKIGIYTSIIGSVLMLFPGRKK